MIDLEIGKWYLAQGESEWYNYFFRLDKKAVYLSIDSESELDVESIVEPIEVFKKEIYDIFDWSRIDAKSLVWPEAKIFSKLTRSDRRKIVKNLF